MSDLQLQVLRALQIRVGSLSGDNIDEQATNVDFTYELVSYTEEYWWLQFNFDEPS